MNTISLYQRKQIHDYLRMMREFVCAQLFKSKLEVREAASKVIVNMDSGKTIQCLYREIEAKIPFPYIQTYYESEYERAFKIKNAAAKLGKIHAEALFLFAELDINIDIDVSLIGSLEANPEIRYLPDGTATVTLSLATTEKWQDKNTREIKEQTESHRLVFYKKLAEITNLYLKKGALIFIEGKLQTKKWVDQNKIEHCTTEIHVTDMKILDSKKNADEAAKEIGRNYVGIELDKKYRSLAFQEI